MAYFISVLKGRGVIYGHQRKINLARLCEIAVEIGY